MVCHGAVYCTALQCTAHCTMPYCTVLYHTLYHTLPYRTVPYCIAVLYYILCCVALHYSFMCFFFQFLYAYRLVARLLNQALHQIGHPSPGQHIQLVSILHHICTEPTSVSQVRNFLFVYYAEQSTFTSFKNKEGKTMHSCIALSYNISSSCQYTR